MDKPLAGTAGRPGYIRFAAIDIVKYNIARVPDDGNAALRRGIRIDLSMAPERRPVRGDRVQVLLDGTNSNTASIVSNYAAQTIGRYSSEVMTQLSRSKMVAGTMAAATIASLTCLDRRSSQ